MQRITPTGEIGEFFLPSWISVNRQLNYVREPASSVSMQMIRS